MEDYLRWDELTDFQKEMAIINYAAIRESEEQKPCSYARASKEVPYCTGFWVDIRYGYVTCNI